MRKMINKETGTEINVVAHAMTKNMWEYYITDDADGDYSLCLVMGFETELGDVYLPEIEPYLISRTKNLEEVLPAEGWQWEA